jgi:hypothetical protein
VTEIHPTKKEIDDSLERIAMTIDGRNLYVFLQRRVMTVTPEAKTVRCELIKGNAVSPRN